MAILDLEAKKKLRFLKQHSDLIRYPNSITKAMKAEGKNGRTEEVSLNDARCKLRL